MKKKAFSYVVIFLLLFIFTSVEINSQIVTAKKIGSTPQQLKTPESVVYDEKNNVLYVSNINGEPDAKDGNGFISIITPEGQIKNLKWIEGLNAPKGMDIYNGKLYVTDIDKLVIIDIASGQKEKEISIPGAVFLNDLVIDDYGHVYITDMLANKIYKYYNGKVSVWLDKNLDAPNGLEIYKNYLYVGNSNYLLKVNLDTKQTQEIYSNTGVIDGLQRDSKGNFIITDWLGTIKLLKGGKQKVLKNQEQNVNAADIEIVGQKMFVPTFIDNKIDIYQLDYK